MPAAALREGFTLFELLIVLVLISLLYFVLIPNFNEKEKKLGMKDIKTFLQSYQNGDDPVTLECIKECSECKIFTGGQSQETGFLTGRAVVHEFKNGYLEEKQYDMSARFDYEGQTCFSYTLQPNGSGSELFVQYQNRIYYLPPFFTQPKIFKNLQEAREHKIQIINQIKEPA